MQTRSTVIAEDKIFIVMYHQNVGERFLPPTPRSWCATKEQAELEANRCRTTYPREGYSVVAVTKELND